MRSAAAIVLLTALTLTASAAVASEASAPMGKTTWEKLDRKVQAGYIVGFLHCLRIARGMEPNGYMARTFMMPPEAKPRDWLAMVNHLYAEKEHAKRSLSQIMVIASQALAAKYGAEEVHSGAGLEALRRAIDERRQAVRDETKPEKAGDADDAKEAADGGKTSDGADTGKASDTAGAATGDAAGGAAKGDAASGAATGDAASGAAKGDAAGGAAKGDAAGGAAKGDDAAGAAKAGAAGDAAKADAPGD